MITKNFEVAVRDIRGRESIRGFAGGPPAVFRLEVIAEGESAQLTFEIERDEHPKVGDVLVVSIQSKEG